MAYLKQTAVAGANKKRGPKKASPSEASPLKVVVTGPDSVCGTGPRPLQHDINYISGLDGIEESLEWIAKGINRLTSDEHPVYLCVGQGSNTNPIKLTLSDNDYEDTMDRLVTSFERIADSVSKLAGFSRPRLESWHEQDEYTPRFRGVSPDSGAPGPPSQQGTGDGSNLESKRE